MNKNTKISTSWYQGIPKKLSEAWSKLKDLIAWQLANTGKI